jgi:hypothetical protein
MKEPIACLWVNGGILPDVVRNVLIAELCKLEPGQISSEFDIKEFHCTLLVVDGFSYTYLGSNASGFRCGVSTVVGDNPDRIICAFLADISLQERNPSKKGALILPLF